MLPLSRSENKKLIMQQPRTLVLNFGSLVGCDGCFSRSEDQSRLVDFVGL